MAKTIFIVRDFSTPALGATLQRLKLKPPADTNIVLPDRDQLGGSILLDVVWKGIAAADRVLIVTDRPSANVGFEIGLAVGVGKPTLFVYHGADRPAWTSAPPLTDLLQGSFDSIERLRELIARDDAWIRTQKAPRLPSAGQCLDLCPSRGEGSALREQRDETIPNGWVRPPADPFALSELNRRLGETDRLVWTIANYPGNADTRDGAENTLNGLLAGWFYARCSEYLEADRRADAPFWVLRSSSARAIADVALHEHEGRPFSGLDDYSKRLLDIESRWSKYRKEEKLEREARPRIAVLDFRTAGREDEIFGHALTEMMIDGLTRVRDLQTIPSTSLSDFSGPPLSFREIGSRLRADFLIEGSVVPISDRYRISVRLIHADDESYVWSHSANGDWTSVQALRAEIVEQVASRLRATLGVQQSLPRPAVAPRPSRALERYHLGRHHLRPFNNRRHVEDLQAANTHFREALNQDPGYVAARLQLGLLQILAWETQGRRELLEASESIWQDVLSSRPDEAVALAESAYLSYVLRGDGLRAVEQARRAAAEDHESAVAPNVLALLYLYLGFWESNVHIEREVVIPRDPVYLYPHTNVALALQLSGDYDAAWQTADEIRKLVGEAFVIDILLGCQHFYRGQPEEAWAAWSRGRQRAQPGVLPVFDAVLAWLPASAGDRLALQTIERYRDAAELTGPYAPYFVSLCALAGETELAIERLSSERTFASSYRYLVTEPTLTPLKSHPRFHKLLESRYYEWRQQLDQLGTGLPSMPPAVPSPIEFLSQAGARSGFIGA
jgi:TolB-like protein